MTFIRFSAVTAVVATLAACGGGEPFARNGPQVVHPSPSALAQGRGTQAAPQINSVEHIVIINTTSPCGQKRQCVNHGSGNDGSSPIID